MKYAVKVLEFLKKHKAEAIRVAAAVCICGITAALVIAFHNGKLPHASDGDAFDTIYAIEESQG